MLWERTWNPISRVSNKIETKRRKLSTKTRWNGGTFLNMIILQDQLLKRLCGHVQVDKVNEVTSIANKAVDNFSDFCKKSNLK